MASVYVDRDGAMFQVTVITAARTKIWRADTRDEAMRIANARMGKRGLIVSTLDMNPEQLRTHQAAEARIRAVIEKMVT